MARPRKGACRRIKLPSVLDLRAARPLHESLLSCRGSDLIMDASAVTELGAQCLQILLAARRTWRNDRSRLTVCDPSAELQAAASLAGASCIWNATEGTNQP